MSTKCVTDVKIFKHACHNQLVYITVSYMNRHTAAHPYLRFLNEMSNLILTGLAYYSLIVLTESMNNDIH